MTIESVYRMYKTAAVLAFITWTAAAAFSFPAAAQGEDVPENYIQEQVHITVPGMEGSSVSIPLMPTMWYSGQTWLTMRRKQT